VRCMKDGRLLVNSKAAGPIKAGFIWNIKPSFFYALPGIIAGAIEQRMRESSSACRILEVSFPTPPP
jgi:hypothetical protein